MYDCVIKTLEVKGFFDYEVFATVLRNECYSARSTGQIIANILSSPSDNRLLAFGKVGKVH